MKIIKQLLIEYKTMHKPDYHTLMKDTVRVAGISIAAAVILKIADTIFSSLLNIIV